MSDYFRLFFHYHDCTRRSLAFQTLYHNQNVSPYLHDKHLKVVYKETNCCIYHYIIGNSAFFFFNLQILSILEESNYKATICRIYQFISWCNLIQLPAWQKDIDSFTGPMSPPFASFEILPNKHCSSNIISLFKVFFCDITNIHK